MVDELYMVPEEEIKNVNKTRAAVVSYLHTTLIVLMLIIREALWCSCFRHQRQPQGFCSPFVSFGFLTRVYPLTGSTGA